MFKVLLLAAINLLICQAQQSETNILGTCEVTDTTRPCRVYCLGVNAMDHSTAYPIDLTTIVLGNSLEDSVQNFFRDITGTVGFSLPVCGNNPEDSVIADFLGSAENSVEGTDGQSPSFLDGMMWTLDPQQFSYAQLASYNAKTAWTYVDSADSPPELFDGPVPMRNAIVLDAYDGYNCQYPTPEPTPEPSPEPTPEPTPEPSSNPSSYPSPEPTPVPSSNPSANPSSIPSPEPTPVPSSNPSGNPSANPSAEPSISPTSDPTYSPTLSPTLAPTSGGLQPNSPCNVGTDCVSQSCAITITGPPGLCIPSGRRLSLPNSAPSAHGPPSSFSSRISVQLLCDPTLQHSIAKPYITYSGIPNTANGCSALITVSATELCPLLYPTAEPTPEPSLAPISEPTFEPSEEPTPEPSFEPSPLPTLRPSPAPTTGPSPAPSPWPTRAPTFFDKSVQSNALIIASVGIAIAGITAIFVVFKVSQGPKAGSVFTA